MTAPADNDTRRRRMVIVGCALAAMLAATAGGIAYVQASNDTAVAKATTTTTAKPTTTAKARPTTTTTTAPTGPRRRSPAGTFTIATLKKQFKYALVAKTLPPSAATAKRQELDPKGAPPFNPDKSRQPLPNMKYQIEGRTALANGWRLDSPGPFGEALTLSVTARQGGWLEVRLPARPNGTRGWVQASAFDLTTTRIQIEVILAEHRVRAWDGNTLIADAPVAVGTPDTKTPTGRHFIVDTEQRDPGGLYGPWILGLDAYSEDMDSFDGGAPQIALHGWQNEEAFGRSVSNGCIRMPNSVIEQLSHAPIGTPVDVWAA